MTRIGLGIGGALLAVGLAAGVTAANQNTGDGQRPSGNGRTEGRMMGRGPGGGALGMLGPIQRLGLTDAQKQQVKTIVDTRAEEFRMLTERARAARQAVQDAVASEPVNDATIRQKSAELAAVEADLAVAGAHARAEVVKILTSEQRERLDQLRANRGERRGPDGRGGRRSGR